MCVLSSRFITWMADWKSASELTSPGQKTLAFEVILPWPHSLLYFLPCEANNYVVESQKKWCCSRSCSVCVCSHASHTFTVPLSLCNLDEVLRTLGEGTFGKVVCCKDRLTGKQVAVKIIKNVPKYRYVDRLKILMKSLQLLSYRCFWKHVCTLIRYGALLMLRVCNKVVAADSLMTSVSTDLLVPAWIISYGWLPAY